MSWTTNNTLGAYLDCQPMCGMRKKLKIMLETVKAVESIHKSKVVHRDLKPENILIEGDLNLKVIDFAESYDLKAK